jgi:hypothetical protein
VAGRPQLRAFQGWGLQCTSNWKRGKRWVQVINYFVGFFVINVFSGIAILISCEEAIHGLLKHFGSFTSCNDFRCHAPFGLPMPEIPAHLKLPCGMARQYSATLFALKWQISQILQAAGTSRHLGIFDNIIVDPTINAL